MAKHDDRHGAGPGLEHFMQTARTTSFRRDDMEM